MPVLSEKTANSQWASCFIFLGLRLGGSSILKFIRLYVPVLPLPVPMREWGGPLLTPAPMKTIMIIYLEPKKGLENGEETVYICELFVKQGPHSNHGFKGDSLFRKFKSSMLKWRSSSLCVSSTLVPHYVRFESCLIVFLHTDSFSSHIYGPHYKSQALKLN